MRSAPATFVSALFELSVAQKQHSGPGRTRHPSIIGEMAVLVLWSLLLSCADESRLDGEPCSYEWQCVNACIRETDPVGDGICGPERLLGEECTRPGYGYHDCEEGSKCSRSGVCVEDSESGSSSTPDCSDGEVHVDGYGCTPTCSSNSDCSTGCCVGLNETSVQACGPAVHCGGGTDINSGGGGGGDSCAEQSSCLAIAEWLQGSNYCANVGQGESTLLPVLQNSCSFAVECKVCGEFGSSLADCKQGAFNAGQSIGGWATDYTWCDADGVRWACVRVQDDYSQTTCLDSWP